MTIKPASSISRPHVTERTKAFWWSLLALGILERAWVLWRFAFRHVGIDDALIWSIARDYGEGIFREPFMYGQNYNLMLEALVAAPFVSLGGDPWIVLPIVTALMALAPFWSWSFWCLRQGSLWPATILAATPLMLPVEWGMLTSMTRGFVDGLALLALLPWTLNWRSAPARAYVSALVLSWAALCNPNMFLPGVVFAIYLVTCDARTWKFWVAGMLGALPAAAFHVIGTAYFSERPSDLVHHIRPDELSWSWDYFREGISDLHEHLDHLFWSLGWDGLELGVVLLLPLLLLLRQRRWPVATFIGIPLLLGILALGMGKTHDGCASLFYPLARMYLGLPLIIALAWSLVLVRRPISFIPLTTLLFVCIISVGWKAYALPEAIQKALAEQECGFVREEPIDMVRQQCLELTQAANAVDADVVVPIPWPDLRKDHRTHFQAHFICYACQELVPGFPPVLGAGFDRRAWNRNALETGPAGTVLFVGGHPSGWPLDQVPFRSVSNSERADLRVVHAGKRSLRSLLWPPS
ncbi:MAG: hypothetical protein KDB88_02030 [Flavobacteriales bacterium]|nr:hypothetical protein [Flavobacteriales bacterium]